MRLNDLSVTELVVLIRSYGSDIAQFGSHSFLKPQDNAEALAYVISRLNLALSYYRDLTKSDAS